MMSGHGGNPIFCNKKNKDWTSRTLAIPHSLRPITSHFCLTLPPPVPPRPPPPHLKVDFICILPLKMIAEILNLDQLNFAVFILRKSMS